MSGKGSAPRPFSVTDEEYAERFAAIDWSDRGEDKVAEAKAEVLQAIEHQLARFDGL